MLFNNHIQLQHEDIYYYINVILSNFPIFTFEHTAHTHEIFIKLLNIVLKSDF